MMNPEDLTVVNRSYLRQIERHVADLEHKVRNLRAINDGLLEQLARSVRVSDPGNMPSGGVT